MGLMVMEIGWGRNGVLEMVENGTKIFVQSSVTDSCSVM